MATAAEPTRCLICNKEKATFLCRGCSQEFCAQHLPEHLQNLSQQLDQIEVNRDLFRQSLTEQQQQTESHPLLQHVDQWERRAIESIHQAAKETRDILSNKTNEFMHGIEVQLNQLTTKLKQSRDENDFNESHLHRFTTELKELSEQLVKHSKMSIQEESTALVHRITINVPRIESKIALRAHVNGKFVCAEHRGKSALIANRNSVSDEETFDLIRLNDKHVALKSHANGKYVCAEDAGNGPLVANRSQMDAWETFELIECVGGKIALRAVNGKYVCANYFGWGVLTANQTHVNRWETFDLVQQ